MRRNLLIATTIMGMMTMPAWAVGTVNQAISPIGRDPGSGPDNRTHVVVINWTGDAITGSVPSTTLQLGTFPAIQGMRVISVEFQPGTPAPSANYSITLTDSLGVDMLAGTGSALSATLSSSNGTVLSPPIVGAPTFNLSGNSVAGAQGKVLISFSPPSQVTGTPATSSLTGGNTFTGTNTFTGPTTISNPCAIDGEIWVSTGGCYTSINAAFAALVGSAGKIRVPPGQPFTITAPITVSMPTTELECEGPFAGININMTGDVFLIQQVEFRVKNCYFTITTTSSRLNSAIFAGGSPNTAGARFQLIDSTFQGNASSPNNGQIERCTGTSANGCELWEMKNIKIPGVATWQNVQIITNSSNVTTADTFNNWGIQTIGTVNFTDGAFVYDGMIDTANFDGPVIVKTNGTGSDLITRNTVGGPAEFPRWIHCNTCEFEGGGPTGGVTAVTFLTGKDQRMSGYIASSQVGVSIGATCIECTVENVVFPNIGQQAVTIAAGAGPGTSISFNRFDSTGVNTANTYDIIQVAANTNNIRFLSNACRNNGANAPKDFTNISGTSTNIVFAGNQCNNAPFGTNFLTNSSSGANVNVYGQDITANDLFLTGSIGLAGGGPFLSNTGGNLTFGGATLAKTVTLNPLAGTYRVTADQTITAGASLTNIPGLTWTFPINTALNLRFSCDLLYSQATAAASDSFGFQDVTVAPTNAESYGRADTSATAFTAANTDAAGVTTAVTVVTFTPSAATTIFGAHIDGVIEQPSNASTSVFNIMAQFTTNNGTIKRGSSCQVF